jgi:hypothetical protein
METITPVTMAKVWKKKNICICRRKRGETVPRLTRKSQKMLSESYPLYCCLLYIKNNETFGEEPASNSWETFTALFNTITVFKLHLCLSFSKEGGRGGGNQLTKT